MTSLQVGDKAPVFSGRDENGNIINLKDYKGKGLILYFYPKDDTPGCTAESCDLRDNYKKWLSLGYDVLGVSPDNEAKHKKFIEKHSLPFPLLADPDRQVIEKYDVWGMKKFMGREYMGLLRTTFVIDEKGKIAEIFTKVKTKTHTNQIIESLEL